MCNFICKRCMNEGDHIGGGFTHNGTTVKIKLTKFDKNGSIIDEARQVIRNLREWIIFHVNKNENRVAYCLERHAEYIEHVIVWIEKLSLLA